MFDEAGVRQRLASTRFPNLRYVLETYSTNVDAGRELGYADVGGTLILAEYQWHGRGRRGRRWLAPPGSGLLFTAVLPRPVRTSVLWAVPFWCALATADGVSAATDLALELQWPNDLLLSGRKVCGILCTSRSAGDSAWVACGVGLNVLRPPSPTAEPEPSAGYLSDALPGVVREDVFVAIVKTLDEHLVLLNDPEVVARAWEARAGVPGARYRIQIDGEDAPFECEALRLTSQGTLIVSSGGRERSVALADARVLRS